jgi:hypothetical protein
VRSGSTRTADSAVRRWAGAAAASWRLIAERPALWLPGALAWLCTVGWAPFVIAVVEPPTVAELTYLGSGFWTSGLWPLNALLVAAGLVAVAVLALAAASAGNAMLVAAAEGRPPAAARDVGRLLALALIGALPVAICVLAIGIATVAVGPAEFNRPEAEPGPVVRLAIRLAPLLVLAVVVAIGSSTLAGLAGRAAMRADDPSSGLAVVPRLARRAGRAGLIHLAATTGFGLLTLVLVGLLLTVLWAPIRAALGAGGALDLASGLLLVGFVAIWLCLVLAGGAVHAWASVTATFLLGGRAASPVADRPQETLIDR